MARPEFNFICRLCIQKIETEEIFPLFSNESLNDTISLPEKIKFCFSVEVTKENGLPSQICSACLCKLNQSFVFRNQCVLADITLKHLLSDLNFNLEQLPNFQKLSITNQFIHCSSDYDTVKKFLIPEEMIPETENINTLNINNANIFNCESKQEFVNSEEKMSNMNQGDLKYNNTIINEFYSDKDYHKKKKRRTHKKVNNLGTECSENKIGINLKKNKKQNIIDYKINLKLNEEGKEICKENVISSLNKLDSLKIYDIKDEKKEESIHENYENNFQTNVKQISKPLSAKRKKTKKLNQCQKPSSYKCNYCSKIYPSEGGWRYHVHTMHSENYQPFICDLCGQPFKVKKNLESHKNSIHFHLKLHICDLCGRGFASKYALKVHKIWHNDEKNFGCEICGTKFRTRGKLNTHKSIHGGPKKFMCHVCSRNFRWKKDFEFHMRTHTGEKPFKCSICCKAFASVSNMKKHEKNHKKTEKLSFSEEKIFVEQNLLKLNTDCKENEKSCEKLQKNEVPGFIYFSQKALNQEAMDILER